MKPSESPIPSAEKIYRVCGVTYKDAVGLVRNAFKYSRHGKLDLANSLFGYAETILKEDVEIHTVFPVVGLNYPPNHRIKAERMSQLRKKIVEVATRRNASN